MCYSFISSFTKTVFSFITIVSISSTVSLAQFAGGSGTIGDPYQIATATHLDNVRNYMSDYFILTEDIDLDLAPYNNGSGWEPIGTNSSGLEFHGHLDGDGHKIKNLFINRPSENFIGLFGAIRYGSVTQIGLEDVDITGQQYVGGITGNSYTLVSYSYVTGSVTATDYAGGITGWVENWTSSGVITNSYSTASVTATNTNAGGLAGKIISGEVTNSYVTGAISSPMFAGGIVGEHTGGTVSSNVFWDVETTGQSSSSGDAIGKTTKQLTTQSTFTNAGWNFSTIWNIVSGDSVSYPYLRTNVQTPIPGHQKKFTIFEVGSGTEADPYLISTPEHLDSVRLYLNAHFKLSSNIDLNVAPYNTASGWEPIGTNGTEFKGVFDGNGYTISNLFINRETTDFVGLFGAVFNGEIKNLGLINVDVTGQNYVGSIIGISYSDVTNSYAIGKLKGAAQLGGLVGMMEDYNGSTSEISTSYALVSIISFGSYSGGLAGRMLGGVIDNSYSAGQIKGIGNDFGGLVGSLENGGSITASYWDTETSSKSSSAGGSGLSSTQMKQQVSFSGWDFTNTWAVDESTSYPYLRANTQNVHPTPEQVPGVKLFAGGTGTENDPYQIATASQLDSVRYLRAGYFIQTADIDLDVAPYNTGEGWLPIGKEANTTFIGSFNGNGFRIKNLFINRPSTSFIGLFRHTKYGAKLTSINIDSANVTGRDVVGTLVGKAERLIVHNVSSSGSITANRYVGGLIGQSIYVEMDSSSSSAKISATSNEIGGLLGRTERGSISNSFATGSVSGSGSYSGGLIGYTYTDTISACYSTGDVTTSGSFAAGFIGFENNTSISNSYATGSVTSTSLYASGFIGRMSGGSITNGYSTGKVTSANSSAAGFVAVNEGGTITNSYWDTQTSTKYTSTGGTALTSEQMGNQSSFTGWDFTTVWAINEGETYPYLRENEQTPHVEIPEPPFLFGGGSGTVINPFRILKPSHLDSIRYFKNYHFVQAADIDMNQAPFNTGLGWNPIGTNTAGQEFSGSYNGNGFVISNLFINRPSTDFVGLFGAGKNAVLKNIGLENVNITGEDYVGGLIGINYSEISASYTTGLVSGYSQTGGLAGAVETWDGSTALVRNSFSTASASSSNTNAGGLVAFLISGTIENSYASGVVSAPSGNGGLIGEKNSGTVTNGYWDIETSTMSTSADGTGLTTAQMKQQNSFSGWNFTTLWAIDEGNNYPVLQENGYNYLTISGDEGWRMISSPVSGSSYSSLLAPLWTQGFTGADVTHGSSNVLIWNEASREWIAPVNASEVPVKGTGFLVYVYADDDMDGEADRFPKILQNQASQYSGTTTPTISFTNTTNMANDGWNLIGNPYGTSIDWDAENGWGKSKLDNTIYVWSDSANGGSGSYLTWNGQTGTLPDGKISAWQGFWVKANEASPALSFTDSVRYRGGRHFKKNPVPELTLLFKKDSTSSSSVIVFNKNAKLQADPYDAYKLQSLNREYISIGTSINGEPVMDIQTLPTYFEPIELDIVFDASDLAGEFALEWSPQNIPSDWEIKLVDRITGTEYDIVDHSSLSFNLSKAKEIHKKVDNENLVPVTPIQLVEKAKVGETRFSIRIVQESVLGSDNPLDVPSVTGLDQNYPNPFNPSTVISYQLPENSKVQLVVFDMLGRKVAELVNRQVEAGYHQVAFNARDLASGMYIYRLQAGNTVITKKLTIIK